MIICNGFICVPMSKSFMLLIYIYGKSEARLRLMSLQVMHLKQKLLLVC